MPLFRSIPQPLRPVGAPAAILLALLAIPAVTGAVAADPPDRFEGIVAAHNAVRAEVGVPPLEWSQDLADRAQGWADTLGRRGCAMEHSSGSGYGENLAWASGATMSPREVVERWAAERRHYDYAANACAPGEVCGHYTQVVWDSTRRVGCGKATCGREEVWVCNYDPPGNIIGRKPY
ncbi:pathogenesis-related family 1 protein [Azospirillum halopraeferens]|uniref:pathogenesis-related family 1 protein n=1 Tax=Azospirillum halopraeferens TaxID=34010 RepID=UPI0003FD2B47|nr:pathogenesis-related family 1 protein [Azospirillum halopraeferens]